MQCWIRIELWITSRRIESALSTQLDATAPLRCDFQSPCRLQMHGNQGSSQFRWHLCNFLLFSNKKHPRGRRSLAGLKPVSPACFAIYCSFQQNIRGAAARRRELDCSWPALPNPPLASLWALLPPRTPLGKLFV